MRPAPTLLGMAMAMLGLLLLLAQAGWVEGATALLLLSGGILLFLVTVRRRAQRSATPVRRSDTAPRSETAVGEAIAIPLATALKAALTIRAPLGQLTISAGSAGPDLLTGRFFAPVSADAHLSGNTLHATLAPAADTPAARVDWHIALHPAVPLKIEIMTGSGSALLDFSRLDLLDLQLTTGVGRCQVYLPQREGPVTFTLRSGTGGVQIHPAEDTAWQVSGVTDRLLVPPDTRVSGPGTADTGREVRLHIAAATGAIRLLPPNSEPNRRAPA
jgi:hypothetical protein